MKSSDNWWLLKMFSELSITKQQEELLRDVQIMYDRCDRDRIRYANQAQQYRNHLIKIGEM